METDTKYCHVTCNPAILNSEPIVKGTRATVCAMVGNWRLGLSSEKIATYPHTTSAQTLTC